MGGGDGAVAGGGRGAARRRFAKSKVRLAKKNLESFCTRSSAAAKLYCDSFGIVRATASAPRPLYALCNKRRGILRSASLGSSEQAEGRNRASRKPPRASSD